MAGTNITIPKTTLDQPDIRVGETVELSMYAEVTSIAGGNITFSVESAQVVDVEPASESC